MIKPQKYIAILICVYLVIACKTETRDSMNTVSTYEEKEEAAPKTYAEISIAQGGMWNGNVYENATSFKNVTALNVPKSHTDHSWYIRYEGPGWESNKVGYRLYLDWRNAIDIFGKVTETMVLPQVGQDGFDSYHEPQSWGSDILKVGKGLGIGSIGRWVDGKIVHFKEVKARSVQIENNKDASSVIVEYTGWKTDEDTIDLRSILSITKDARFTKHTITPSKEITGIVTGIVNHQVNYFENVSEDVKWSYIATYGAQTLVPDYLGMAIFYERETVAQLRKGEYDHLIEFKPTTAPVAFYFLAAWEQEKNGIKTEKEFITYLENTLQELNRTGSLK